MAWAAAATTAGSSSSRCRDSSKSPPLPRGGTVSPPPPPPPILRHTASSVTPPAAAGVLTKLDLMDPGTDARDVLSGRVVALKRGFVPVVGRSQKEINEAMPVDKALARERLFFERHPCYRAFAARCGTLHLTRLLSSMLFAAVKAWAPTVRSEISSMIQGSELALRELGDPVTDGADGVGGGGSGPTLLLKLLSRFATNFSDMVEGRVHGDDADTDLLTAQMFGGARIQEVIRSRFYCATAEWLAAFQRNDPAILPDEEILMALRNSSGPGAPLFVPDQAFVALVRRQIASLKELGRKFVEAVRCARARVCVCVCVERGSVARAGRVGDDG